MKTDKQLLAELAERARGEGLVYLSREDYNRFATLAHKGLRPIKGPHLMLHPLTVQRWLSYVPARTIELARQRLKS